MIVPPRHLQEIVQLPEAEASLTAEHYQRFQGKYTGFGKFFSFANIVHMARNNILRRSAQSIELMQDEVVPAVSTTLGKANDWSAVPLFGTVNVLVARVVSRVFVGVPRCRDLEWVRKRSMPE